MKIRYLGQCTFLIEHNGAALCTDPYLSDYVDRNFYSESTPWQRMYAPPVRAEELHVDGILLSHDHGDHMDPWTLAKLAGPGVVCAAPAPVCQPLQAMPFGKVVPALAEESFSVGPFSITPIVCAHTVPHTDALGRYHELSYFVHCGDETLFFGGDMSLYPGLTERIAREQPDVLLLPANGADEDRTARNIIGNTNCEEAAALAAETGGLYIPMHHDLYAINGETPENIVRAAQRHGAKLRLLAPGEIIETEAKT